MHDLIETAASIHEILAHCIKASLLAGEHKVKSLGTLLPLLWCFLEPPVPIQHLQQPVGFVTLSRLAQQVVVYIVVRRAERVHVGLIKGQTGQTHSRAGTIRAHLVARFLQYPVRLHRPIVIRRTHGAKLQGLFLIHFKCWQKMHCSVGKWYFVTSVVSEFQ